MKKIVIGIIAIVIVLISIFAINNKEKKVSKTFYFMDTYIEVNLYGKDERKLNVALDDIYDIYETYHKLCDKRNAYDDVVNLYTIYHNDFATPTLKIDKRLYDLLEFALSFDETSNHRLNVNLGNLLDLWEQYRLNGGIPSEEELSNTPIYPASNVVLLDNNEIVNNHQNIDLGSVAKGYATKKAGEYLNKQNITNYIINAGGNVLVGKKGNNTKYKIGIEDPNDSSNLYEIINANDVSVVTSGSYQRYYEYNGVKYHHIIDPKTKYPSNYMKAVSVIAKDSALADALSTTLFLMSIDEGKEFIKNFEATAIWYSLDDEIIKGEGFSAYE